MRSKLVARLCWRVRVITRRREQKARLLKSVGLMWAILLAFNATDKP